MNFQDEARVTADNNAQRARIRRVAESDKVAACTLAREGLHLADQAIRNNPGRATVRAVNAEAWQDLFREVRSQCTAGEFERAMRQAVIRYA